MTVLRLRQQGLEWRLVDDEVVALDLGTSRYVSTNKAGAVLWNDLAEGTTREALVAGLMDRWGIDHPRGEADVDEFLTLLGDRDLLEPADTASG